MDQTPDLYRCHRFPGEIISHAVWLYHTLSLSFRDVELLLAERGVIVSYESVRRWCLKFGGDLARRLRRRRPKPGDTWHLDEVSIPSAKSGSPWQSREAGHARLGAGQPAEPAHDARDVHRAGDADLLEPGLRQPDVAAPAHPECAHALREGALDPGPPVIALLPSGAVHPRPRRIQRLVLLAGMELDGAARDRRRRA
jgi:putative transposase